ncbi:hypothetical protein ACQPWY_03255 [Pseudonocardia xinjiangensis]|uniref:hypothetical protein n=1 Tax=Pseudonocardia xinjiangensis TaxID=75289 RepID=UPI003D8D77FE
MDGAAPGARRRSLIRSLPEEIRQVLDSTFSLQDVLLTVGDRRFRTAFDDRI